MKIIKDYKLKDEDKYFEPFLKFYLSKYFPQYKEVPIQVHAPDESNRSQRPDYYIVQTSSVVEVKEIHDKGITKSGSAWHHNMERLHIKKDTRIKDVKGRFLIEIPLCIRIPRGQEESVRDAIFKAISSNQASCDVLGYTLRVEKRSAEGSGIRFISSKSKEYCSINPAQTIYDNISKELAKANVQLNFPSEEGKVGKRILLLVNKYIFGEEIGEHIEALSYNYDKLLRYTKIDEIWLQFEKTEDTSPEHHLLYTRPFLEQLHNRKLTPNSDNELFEKWFFPLSEMGDEHKDRLFCGLKGFLSDKKPSQVFIDRSVIEGMVGLGEWLINKKRFDDVVWLIETFIDDPDPEEPEDYKGDPAFNYHQQIVDGEDPSIITTVRGHLAWVVQKLVVEKNYILKAFDYTKKLLRYQNLYAKLQATVPLTEIAARRQWLEEQNPKKYHEFHDITFDLLRNYSKYPAVAKALSHVFFYYKDLTTAESCEVLENLKITDESASLFVYFALIRERHYKSPDGTDKRGFEAKLLKDKLEEIIKSDNDSYFELQSSILWNFWKLLEGNPKEFNTVRPYIDLFLQQPYKKNRYSYTHVERTIEDWVQKEPEICIDWFEQFLGNISEFIKSNKSKAKNVWLSSPEKIMNTVANEKPEKLVGFAKTLVKLWMKGVFIGSPKQLFETFKLIQEEELRLGTKKEFRILYKSMKEANPKLEKVSWN